MHAHASTHIHMHSCAPACVLQHPASAAEFVVDLAQWLELHADPLSSDTEHAGSEGGAATLSASAAHSLSHLHGSEHMLLVGRDLLAHAVYLGQAAIADALLAQLVGPPFCCSLGLLADSGPQTGERGPPSTGLLLAALLSSELGMVEKVWAAWLLACLLAWACLGMVQEVGDT